MYQIYYIMEINNKLFQEIKEFCELNGISDVEKEVHKMLTKGFNIEKYGTSPFQTVMPIFEEKNEIIEEKPKKKVGRPKKTEEIKEKEVAEEIKPKRRVRIIKND